MTASDFPDALDTDVNLGRVVSTDALVPAHHNNLLDAIEAIEAFIGPLDVDWPNYPSTTDPMTVVDAIEGALTGLTGGVAPAHAATHVPGGTDPLYNDYGNTLSAAQELFGRDLINLQPTLTAGILWVVHFTPNVSRTVSSIHTVSGTTAAVGSTLTRVGLYTVGGTGALTLVARSASNLSLWAAQTTDYNGAFDTAGGYPSSYALVRGTRYAIGLITVGNSTAPTVRGCGSTGVINSLAPVLAGQLAAQTDLPTSVAAGGLASAGNRFWGYLA